MFAQEIVLQPEQSFLRNPEEVVTPPIILRETSQYIELFIDDA